MQSSIDTFDETAKEDQQRNCISDIVNNTNDIEEHYPIDDTNEMEEQNMEETSHEKETEEEEALDMEEDPIDCAVCNSTTQHVCVLCGKNVCQIFCSEQDPNSTNEYHRKHKDNDPRCVEPFTCSVCDERFPSKTNFDNHMNNHNETSYEELTQLSSASESLLSYVSCKSCGEKFENELDLKIHHDNHHTEELKCQECSFKTNNQSMMENHVRDIHPKNIYQKRIKQNLLNVDLEEESEDEYQPSDFDEENEEKAN